jgi:hypothetical protein
MTSPRRRASLNNQYATFQRRPSASHRNPERLDERELSRHNDSTMRIIAPGNSSTILASQIRDHRTCSTPFLEIVGSFWRSALWCLASTLPRSQVPRRQRSLVQQQLRHVARQAMYVVAQLRKVSACKFVRLDKDKNFTSNRTRPPVGFRDSAITSA